MQVSKLKSMLFAAVAVVAGAMNAMAASWYQLPLTYSNGVGSYFTSAENPCYLFDNNYTTKWCDYWNSNRNWVEFYASPTSRLVPTRLDLVCAADTSGCVNRNWTGWTLYGWNGSSWETVQAWSGQYPSTTASATTTYTFSNEKGYHYFRLVINSISNSGASEGAKQQMGDLKLYAYVPDADATELVTNGSFENGTALGNNSYSYHNASCSTTSWSGGSGRQRGSSTWASVPYAGSYVMWFQSAGAASQSIDFPVAGTYRLSFAYTTRCDANYGNHYRGVKLGEKVLST